jgi:DNA topoisomerase-1
LSLNACKNGECIDAELVSIDGEKVKNKNITNIENETRASELKKAIEESKTITIKSVKESERKLKPKSPFTTASLQQTAYSSLGFSVKQTSSVAQRLYQGVALDGDEVTGLISYMRTDSTNLSDECLKDINSFLDKNHPDLAYGEVRKYQKKIKNAQEAHEAIRPTQIDLTPDKIKGFLDDQEFKLYELIWKRTVASQMKDAVYNQVSMELELNNKYLFKYSGSYLKDYGFKKIYDLSDNSQKEDNKKILEKLKTNDVLDIKEVKTEQKFTQPPPRYNQASLIQALEELGIGRPSTYVTIISKILDSNYVDPEKSNFQPTALAKVVCDTLIKHFGNDLVDFEFTARLENYLDEIANGEKETLNCIKDTYEPFRANLENKLETVDISELRELKDLGTHPDTGRPVTVRLTKYGPTIQMGTREDEEKPKWAALTPELKKNIDSITMEHALELFELPKKIGEFESKDIRINIGPYGPYVNCDKTNVSVKDKNIFEIDEKEAIELIIEKREIDANKEINIFEESGVKVLNGPYGPYVTDGKKNVRVPKDTDPKSLSEEVCLEMLKNAPKRRARFRRRKS